MHVDVFLKDALDKGILDIKLFESPVSRDTKDKNKADGGGFNKRTKGFSIIKTFLLIESLCNDMSFVPLKCTSTWHFTLKTRQHPIMFMDEEGEISVHVLFFTTALYSSLIALRQ